MEARSTEKIFCPKFSIRVLDIVKINNKDKKTQLFCTPTSELTIISPLMFTSNYSSPNIINYSSTTKLLSHIVDNKLNLLICDFRLSKLTTNLASNS